MKKIIIYLFLVICLVNCGNDKPKVYSFQEKEVKMIIAIFEDNKKMVDEINRDIESWQKLSNNGDSEAKKEYSEWILVKQMVDKHHAEVNYESAKDWLEKNK